MAVKVNDVSARKKEDDQPHHELKYAKQAVSHYSEIIAKYICCLTLITEGQKVKNWQNKILRITKVISEIDSYRKSNNGRLTEDEYLKSLNISKNIDSGIREGFYQLKVSPTNAIQQIIEKNIQIFFNFAAKIAASKKLEKQYILNLVFPELK